MGPLCFPIAEGMLKHRPLPEIPPDEMSVREGGSAGGGGGYSLDGSMRWTSRENLLISATNEDPQLFVALYDFQSGGENQLSLKKGQPSFLIGNRLTRPVRFLPKTFNYLFIKLRLILGRKRCPVSVYGSDGVPLGSVAIFELNFHYHSKRRIVLSFCTQDLNQDQYGKSLSKSRSSVIGYYYR